MPYHIVKKDGKFCVAKKSGQIMHCYDNKKAALKYLAALVINVEDATKAATGYSVTAHDKVNKLMRKRQRLEQVLNRSASIDLGKVDKEKRIVPIALSSEYPVDRGWYVEILSHDPGNVDLSRVNNRHPFLLNHNQDNQIGVIVDGSANIGTDRILRMNVRMGKSGQAEEIFQDILDGIRTHVSVGYEQTKELSVTRDEHGKETVIFAWKPYEASVVPVPADPTVGVGRGNGPIDFEKLCYQKTISELRASVFAGDRAKTLGIIQSLEEMLGIDLDQDSEIGESEAHKEIVTANEPAGPEGAGGGSEPDRDVPIPTTDQTPSTGATPEGQPGNEGPAKCPHCGSPVPDGNKHCTHCGMPMRDDVAEV